MDDNRTFQSNILNAFRNGGSWFQTDFGMNAQAMPFYKQAQLEQKLPKKEQVKRVKVANKHLTGLGKRTLQSNKIFGKVLTDTPTGGDVSGGQEGGGGQEEYVEEIEEAQSEVSEVSEKDTLKAESHIDSKMAQKKEETPNLEQIKGHKGVPATHTAIMDIKKNLKESGINVDHVPDNIFFTGNKFRPERQDAINNIIRYFKDNYSEKESVALIKQSLFERDSYTLKETTNMKNTFNRLKEKMTRSNSQ